MKKVYRYLKNHIFIFITLCILVASAATIPIYGLTMHRPNWIIGGFNFVDSQTGHRLYTYLKTDAKGNYVYCLNPERDSPAGQDYKKSDLMNDVIYRTIKNGYPNKTFLNNPAGDYIITQMAVWINCGAISETDFNNGRYSLAQDGSIGSFFNEASVKKYVLQLVEKGKTDASDGLAPHVSFNKTNYTTSYTNGESYIKSEWISFNIGRSGVKGSGAFDITLDKDIPGVVYELKDGRKYPSLDGINSGTVFRILVPKGTDTGSARISASGKITRQVANKYICTDQYLQNVVDFEKEDYPITKTNIASFSWKKVTNPGRIMPHKINEKNEPLEGAVFEIYAESDTNKTNCLGTITTDSNGNATSKILDAGKYKLYEITAPEGYAICSPVYVTVDGDVTPTIKNYRSGSAKIIIKKLDKENNRPLENAVFFIRSTKTGTLFNSQAVRTNAEGIVMIEVPMRTNDGDEEYVIVESAAPSGYITDYASQKVTFTPYTERNTFNLTFYNERIDKEVWLRKYVAKDVNGVETRVALDNAEFDLINADTGEVLDTQITNSSGELSFHMGPGNFKIVETKPPIGYLPLDKPITFTVNDKTGELINTSDYTLSSEGWRGVFLAEDELDAAKIQITKKDSKTGATLQGAVFNLYQNGEVIASATTDENGVADFGEFMSGDYMIKEVTAPTNYVLSEQEYNFTLAHDKPYIKTITNEHVKGKLQITKKDSTTSAKLQNAVIALYNADGQEVGRETSDESGVVTFDNLEFGNYTYKEITAPTGYVLSTKVTNVTIQSATTVTSTLTNTKSKPPVKVYKSDMDTKKPLAQATFVLKKANGTYIKTITTGTDGYANVGNLEYGDYTLTETVAPTGYIKTSSPVAFTIDATAEGGKTINVPNGKIRATTTLIKKDADTGDKIGGATFNLLQNGTVLKTFEIPSNGVYNLGDLDYGDYTLVETKAPEGYKLDSTPINFKISSTSEKIIEVTNSKITAGVKVKKIDADNTNVGLSGAVFQLYKGTELIGEYTTSTSGYANLGSLEIGTYKLVEKTAPANYNKAADTTFEVTANTQDLVVYVKDSKFKSTVNVVKTNEDGSIKLQGAEFTLYKDDEVIKTVTTLANGEATFGAIPSGTYTVKETKAPAGYLSDSTPQTLIIDKNGETKTLTFKDTRIEATVRLIKTDEQGNKINGAKFEIYKGTEKVRDYTITSNGYIDMTNMPVGTFTVKEIEAPEGYKISTETKSFTITEADNGKTKEVAFTNKRITGKVKITKRNPNGTLLKNAKFKLYKVNDSSMSVWETLKQTLANLTNKTGEVDAGTLTGTEVGTYTNTTGTLTISDLEYGDYYLEEATAPTGYVKSTKQYPFTISEQDVTITCDCENTPIKGAIKITKKDTNGVVVPGAEITLWKADKTTKVKSITVGDDGVALFEDLPYGTYYYQETKAPVGYALNNTMTAISVTSQGKLYTGTIVNTLKPRDISIKKVDKDTLKGIPNVTIDIYDSNKLTVVETITTDTQGLAKISLPVGTYYYKEKVAPTGYVLNTNFYQLVLTKDSTGVVGNLPNTKIKGKLKITKVDDSDKPLKDVEFTILAQDKVTVVDTIKTDANGEASISLEYGTYYYKEKSAPAGYVPDTLIHEFKIEKNNATVNAKVTNKKITGTFKINKTSFEANTPIDGVVFEIYKEDKTTKVATLTTANGGVATKDLPYGTYYFKEVSAPKEYIVDNSWKSFSIKSDGATVTQNIKNTKAKGGIQIIKKNADKTIALEGAVFIVYNQDHSFEKEITTDANGSATLELDLGTYYFKEKTAPTGYVLNETEHEFKIESNTQIYNTTVTNEKKKGVLSIIKFNGDKTKPLAHAFFDVIDKATQKVVKSLETNDEGKASVKLLYGDYTLVETKAPKGYILDTASFEFTISDTTPIINKEITNMPITGKLHLTKKDISTGKVLPNAKFKIYAEDKKTVVTEGITNDLGYVEFDLEYGKYYYQEYEAPIGYVLDDTLFPFEIKSNGEIVKAEMTNDKINGGIEITKTDISTGELIPRVSFRIYAEDKTTIVKEGATDDKGVAKFDLDYGKYYYQEYDAPPEYLIDETLFPFEIKSDGEIVKAKMTNKKKIGTLELTKTDISTGELLPNTEFAIYDADGETIIEKGVTDENGLAKFTLSYGNYYYQEFNAPEGYVIDTEKFPFEIKEDGQIVKAEMKNRKVVGDVEITKSDISTGELIPGTSFRIYAEDKTTIIKEDITNNEGVAKFTLEYGKYYYQEFDAPEEYVVDESLFPFEIKEDGEIVKCKMTDKKKSGELEITKLDISNGEVLPNASFIIYAEDGETIVEKGTTDETGIASFKLDYGKYFYQEFIAPEGYVVDSEKYPFEIKNDGEIVKCDMVNHKLPKTGTLAKTRNIFGCLLVAFGVSLLGYMVYISKKK